MDIPYLNNLMEAEHGGNINEQHYFNDCYGPVWSTYIEVKCYVFKCLAMLKMLIIYIYVHYYVEHDK